MNTLTIQPGDLVFLSGMPKDSIKAGRFEDMDGHVTSIDTTYNHVSVKWDHPAMAQQGPIKYGAEDFISTTHRAGHLVFVLHI